MPDEVTMETEQPVSALDQNPESPSLGSSGPEGRKERLAEMATKLAPKDGKAPASAITVPATSPEVQLPTALNQEQINALIQEAIKKQQEAIRREIGLGNVLPRRLQGLPDKLAELEKRLSNASQTNQPGVLSTLPPEQQAAYKALIKEILESEYGEKFKKYDGFVSAQEVRETVGGVIDRAKSMLGDKYTEMEPFAVEAFTELKAAAETDDEANIFLDELYKTRSGLIAFLSEVQRRYSANLAKNNAGAVAAVTAKAKSASTVVSGTSRSSGAVPDVLANRPDPKNRKEWLEKAKTKLGMAE